MGSKFEHVKICLDNCNGKIIPITLLHERMITQKMTFAKGSRCRDRVLDAVNELRQYAEMGHDVVVVKDGIFTPFLECSSQLQKVAARRFVRHVNAVTRKRLAISKQTKQTLDVVTNDATKLCIAKEAASTVATTANQDELSTEETNCCFYAGKCSKFFQRSYSSNMNNLSNQKLSETMQIAT